MQVGHKVLVKKLQSAQRWLKRKQSTKWKPDTQKQVNLLVQACVSILGQGIRNYHDFVARKNRTKKIKGRYTSPPNNKALRDLVAVTVSDLHANAAFQPMVDAPWQLDDWNTGTYICTVCGKEFGAKKKARFCSNKCNHQYHRKTRDRGVSRIRASA